MIGHSKTEGNAGVPSVERFEFDKVRIAFHSRLREQVFESHAFPHGVRNQIAADGIGDAGERAHLRDRRHRLEIVERQCERLVDQASDRQFPIGGNRWGRRVRCDVEILGLRDRHTALAER